MKNDALKFLQELTHIIGRSYPEAVDAVSAIRSTGAYEDSGLYHVNIKGAGSFAFAIVKNPDWCDKGFHIVMDSAYPEEL